MLFPILLPKFAPFVLFFQILSKSIMNSGGFLLLRCDQPGEVLPIAACGVGITPAAIGACLPISLIQQILGDPPVAIGRLLHGGYRHSFRGAEWKLGTLNKHNKNKGLVRISSPFFSSRYNGLIFSFHNYKIPRFKMNVRQGNEEQPWMTTEKKIITCDMT